MSTNCPNYRRRGHVILNELLPELTFLPHNIDFTYIHSKEEIKILVCTFLVVWTLSAVGGGQKQTFANFILNIDTTCVCLMVRSRTLWSGL